MSRYINKSERNDHFSMKWQQFRSASYSPILSLLSRLGVKANYITYSRLILGIIFLMGYETYPKISSSLIIFAVFLDSVDGALARYQKNASDRGKFFDILVDYISYSFIVSTFLSHGVSPGLIIHNIWLVAAAWLLAIIYKEEGRDSDWIIKPYPRELTIVAIPIIAFVLFELFSINLLKISLIYSTVYSAVASIIYLHLILRRWRAI